MSKDQRSAISLLVAAVLLVGAVSAVSPAAWAQDDPCSLLTPAEIDAVLGTNGATGGPGEFGCRYDATAPSGEAVGVQLLPSIGDADGFASGYPDAERVTIAGADGYAFLETPTTAWAVAKVEGSAPAVVVSTQASGVDRKQVAMDLLVIVVGRLAGRAPSAPPSYAPPSRPPIAEPSPEPEVPATAEGLILADIAAGDLDEPTGLLYQVYASFGDPRLPERYAALPTDEEPTALSQAALRIDDLPADVADELTPYLVRPADPRSVFNPPPSTAVAAGARVAQVECGTGGWARSPSSKVPVVVWAPCSSADAMALVPDTLAAVEAHYPPEVELMGPPILDEGGPDAGGDTSIDVYLLGRCVSRGGECFALREGPAGAPVRGTTWLARPFQGPPGARTTSAFIGISVAAAASSTDLRSTVAHELFHVLQDAHNAEAIVTGGDPAGTKHWFTEASAVWAVHFFVPEARASRVYPLLQTQTGADGRPIGGRRGFQDTDKGLTWSASGSSYTAWVWPLFMQQESGESAIGAAWRAMEGATSADALDQAISSVVPFETEFLEFALRAWNTDLPAPGADPISPRFQALDDALPPIGPTQAKWSSAFDSPSLTALDDSEPPYRLEVHAPPLGIRYHEFMVGDWQQMTFDLSGLSSTDQVDVEALIHHYQGDWERRSFEGAETQLCRIERDNQVIDQVMLVIANHSPVDRVDGAYTVDVQYESCIEGPYSVDLSPAGLRGGGHYEGTGRAISCSPSEDGRWTVRATWIDEDDAIQFIDIDPRFGMSVDVRGLGMELSPWWVILDFGGHVTLDVDESVWPPTFVAHGSSEVVSMTVTATCTVVAP